MITGQTICLSGVAEKSNVPLKYSHADMIGLRVAWRKRLRLISAFPIFFHLYLRKEGSAPARMARRCDLNMQMALFRYVTAMEIRWYELIFGVPAVFNDLLVRIAALLSKSC